MAEHNSFMSMKLILFEMDYFRFQFQTNVQIIVSRGNNTVLRKKGILNKSLAMYFND